MAALVNYNVKKAQMQVSHYSEYLLKQERVDYNRGFYITCIIYLSFKKCISLLCKYLNSKSKNIQVCTDTLKTDYATTTILFGHVSSNIERKYIW